MTTLTDKEIIRELLNFYGTKSIRELVLIQNRSIVKLQDENAKLTSFVSPYFLKTLVREG
jgi:hypothetical protein